MTQHSPHETIIELIKLLSEVRRYFVLIQRRTSLEIPYSAAIKDSEYAIELLDNRLTRLLVESPALLEAHNELIISQTPRKENKKSDTQSSASL